MDTYLGHRVIRASMNDGRELIYFDDLDTKLTETRKPDVRESAPRFETASMRFDALMGEWVSIASGRNARAHLPATDQCPLCVQSATNLSEIPDQFDVAVFENKSPSFGPGLETTETPTGFGTQALASGRCEVVVFSPIHQGSLGEQSLQRIKTVITAWRHRTAELMSLDGIETVFPFENRGTEIGVTLHHPHGQIYGYPFIPPTTQKIINSAKAEPSFFDSLLEFELSSDRILISTELFTVFVPFAARWPLEITLMPNRAVRDLTELTEAELDELAVIYQKLLIALDDIYASPLPYIAACYQAPKGVGAEEFRLHIKITSPKRAATKLKFLAGSESAMGAWISDVLPEAQAEMIRKVLQ